MCHTLACSCGLLLAASAAEKWQILAGGKVRSKRDAYGWAFSDGGCVFAKAIKKMHILQFHKITESFGLEGTLKAHLDQLPCNEHGQLQLSQIAQSAPSLTLNVTRDGAPTTSLGNLIQCLTTLTVKLFLLLPHAAYTGVETLKSASLYLAPHGEE